MTMVLLECNAFIMTTCWVQPNVIEWTPTSAKESADLLASLDNAISRAVEPSVIASGAKQSHRRVANHPSSPRLLRNSVPRNDSDKVGGL